MDESQQKTVGIKQCGACGSGLLEPDRFCRRCGVHQPNQQPDQDTVAILPEPSAYKTSALLTGTRVEVYRRVSGPLVNLVVSGALAGHSIDNESRVLKRVILALISIPVWLIIVLLSPLDAYAAVRNLARQA
jgi:hypothetical protein